MKREGIFIAGPMTGEEIFAAYASRLHNYFGTEVFNPYNWGFEDTPYGLALIEDVNVMLTQCNTVFLAPGWEQSPGTVAEIAIALASNGKDGVDIDFIEDSMLLPGEYLTVIPDVVVRRLLRVHSDQS